MNKKHGAWSKNEKIFFGLLAPILVLFFHPLNMAV